jgi:hypothetical protein
MDDRRCLAAHALVIRYGCAARDGYRFEVTASGTAAMRAAKRNLIIGVPFPVFVCLPAYVMVSRDRREVPKLGTALCKRRVAGCGHDAQQPLKKDSITERIILWINPR